MAKQVSRVPKIKKIRRVGYGIFSPQLFRWPIRFGTHRRRRKWFHPGVLLPLLFSWLMGRRRRRS